jgi:hypothetical protein
MAARLSEPSPKKVKNKLIIHLQRITNCYLNEKLKFAVALINDLGMVSTIKGKKIDSQAPNTSPRGKR